VTDGETQTVLDDGAPKSRWAARREGRKRIQIQGEDLGRIISLSDGVFAFALTLLVLSLAVPSSTLIHTNGQLGSALNKDWPTFLGYAFAFVMIAIWWIVHNRTYQYIARFDSTLVWINMALLAQIAVMPFILTVYTTYSEYQYAVILFDAVQISLGVTTAVLWEYAKRAKLAKPGVPEAVSRYFTRRSMLSAAVFVASIGISFVNVSFAQYTWFLILVVQRVLSVEGD
jgi:uncharacterized membrane protein